MDLDALHRNVTRLMKFMERVEKQVVVADQDAPPLNDAKVKELEERVQAFGERLDQADLANLNDRLGALADRLEQGLAAVDQHQQQVSPALQEVSELLPSLKQMSEVATWFQQNRANLEGAIAMADAFDGPNASEQAADGLPAGADASSAEPAPEVPAAVDASQAASDKPAGT